MKANKVKELRKVTCDQEAWVKGRIESTIKMAMSLKENRRVGADDPMYVCGLNGIINGAAWEIIRTVGLDIEGANIYNPYSCKNNNIKEPID